MAGHSQHLHLSKIQPWKKENKNNNLADQLSGPGQIITEEWSILPWEFKDGVLVSSHWSLCYPSQYNASHLHVISSVSHGVAALCCTSLLG